MLKIKLTRLGKKSEPRYRIVVNEARCRRDGEYVALLGIYQPTMSPKLLQLDLPAYQDWLKKGAQPTATVAFLAKVATEGKGFPQKKPTLSKKALAKAQAAKAEREKEKTATQKEAAPQAADSKSTPTNEVAVKVTPTNDAASGKAAKKD